MRQAVVNILKGCNASPGLGVASFHSSSRLCVAPAEANSSNETATSSSLAYVSYENPEFSQIQTPLIIQHGLFGRKENFSQLGKKFHHLTKRGVLLPDVRNHGASPPCRALSLRQMSADLIRLTSQLELEKVCMLGYATGGRVAMLTALNRPELVDRLVVVSSSPLNTQESLDRWLKNREACLVLAQLLQRNGSLDARSMEGGMLGIEFKLEANEALKPILVDSNERALFLSNLGKVNVDFLLNCSDDLGTFPSMQGQTFSAPTLFITGAKAPVWDGDREVRSIRQLFPNSHFVKIPGASHWVHTEASGDFLAATVSFLQTEF